MAPRALPATLAERNSARNINYNSGKMSCQTYMKAAKYLNNKKLPPKHIPTVSLVNDESMTPTKTQTMNSDIDRTINSDNK